MGPFDKIRRALGTLRSAEDLAERSLVLSAQLLTEANRRRGRIPKLADVEVSAYSQWGEDGIIDWLVERLHGLAPTFVEFGVEDYRESNTRFLLKRRNWRGVVIDGSAEQVAAIRSQDLYWRHDLTAIHAFVARENINEIIRDAGVGGDIGLLSIDIDGNDYWVWEAIECVSPALVICEYNAVFGDVERISVPYRPDFDRRKAHPSNLFFGASLPALIGLGTAKRYRFIGTTSSGGNAFFVREDRAKEVVGRLDQIRSFPSKFREGRDAAGKLLFARAEERLRLIRDLEVHDFKTGSTVPLRSYENLYSDAWRVGQ